MSHYSQKCRYAFLTFRDGIDCLVSRIFLYGAVKKLKEDSGRPVWLFGERKNDARENAYALFIYVREHHPEVDAYYVINTNAPQAQRVLPYGNVIEYGSQEHKKIFFATDILISAYFRGTIEPWRQRVFKILYRPYFAKKYVFVQHGVIKDDLSALLDKDKEYFDLFISGAQPEYEYLLESLQYTSDEIKYTGLARYDFFHDIATTKVIALVPTWRRYIAHAQQESVRGAKDTFLHCTYYATYQQLLASEKLHEILEEYDLTLVFYQHAEMQKYNQYFETASPRIRIADEDHDDVQQLLTQAPLVITDYSSVFFDAAYMHKPLIYFQFDEAEFFANHYARGYFDYRRDGFGPVCVKKDELIDEIQKNIEQQFRLPEKYRRRAEHFFPLHDTHNRARIVAEIKKL